METALRDEAIARPIFDWVDANLVSRPPGKVSHSVFIVGEIAMPGHMSGGGAGGRAWRKRQWWWER